MEMIGLSHLLKESTSKTEAQIVIDDLEVLEAISKYNEGRIMKKNAEDMIEQARKVLDEKLYKNGIMRSESSDTIVQITEYSNVSFDKVALQKEFPDVYNRYSTSKKLHRYTFSLKGAPDK